MSSLSNILVTANMSSRTSASSARGETSSLSAHARPAPPKSDIEIRLRHHYKTKTYTSSSPIEGDVTITTQKDVRFDSVEIVLIGSSKTRTEGYSAPHESSHTFLKLTMPIPESVYPEPRILEAGRTLTVPFTFVLPTFLTINACNHRIESDHFRQKHLCLPPSMGSWARGNWEKDDLAPSMAEVVYSIKARVWSVPETRTRTGKIMEAVKAIQVLPAFAEDAPLSISWDDSLYKMSKTKTLRKNIISSKLGTLVVSAQQPRAVMLHPDGRVAVGSQVQLDLSFEPVSPDVQPPKMTGVSTKITAHTYYSSAPIRTPPNAGEWMRQAVSDRRGEYSASVNLPAEPPKELFWHAHSINRRDSGYSSDTGPENPTCSEDEPEQPEPQPNRQRRRSLANLIRPSKTTVSASSPVGSRSPPRQPAGLTQVHHSTTLHLPLTLPTARKTFVPTFHSCILSRVYTLRVTLNFGALGGSTAVSLDLPLQVAVEASAPSPPGPGEELPSWEDAIEDAAVDELLSPRMLRLPGGEPREMAAGVPPEYVWRS